MNHNSESSDGEAALLKALLAASEEFSQATTPEGYRRAWSSYLKALYDFILQLKGSRDDTTRAVVPLEQLVGDLATLDGGTTPRRLTKTKRPGRGKAPAEEITNKAIAAAVIDQLMTEPDINEDAASKKVFREMQKHGLLPAGTTAKTLSNFRRDIYRYGEEAITIKKSLNQLIGEKPPAERTKFAMSRIGYPGKLKLLASDRDET